MTATYSPWASAAPSSTALESPSLEGLDLKRSRGS